MNRLPRLFLENGACAVCQKTRHGTFVHGEDRPGKRREEDRARKIDGEQRRTIAQEPHRRCGLEKDVQHPTNERRRRMHDALPVRWRWTPPAPRVHGALVKGSGTLGGVLRLEKSNWRAALKSADGAPETPFRSIAGNLGRRFAQRASTLRLDASEPLRKDRARRWS